MRKRNSQVDNRIFEGDDNDRTPEKIIKAWGKPKGKKESFVFLELARVLRSFFIENTLSCYTFEALLLNNQISVNEFKKWEIYYRNREWFKNALQDIREMLKMKILLDARRLGAEIVKTLLQDEQSNKEIKIIEYIQNG